MAKKKKRTKRDLKKELRAIYEGADGKLPDLSQLSHKDKSKFTSLLIKTIIVLLTLSVIAWSGFFLFTEGLFKNNEALLTEIEGPDKIRSGEQVSYTVRYQNTGDVPIASLDMKLNLPQSFHVTSTIPSPTNESEWSIGSLSPKSDGAVIIRGIFLSEVPSNQKVQALFTYKPANFSSEFQEITTKQVEINDSVIKLVLNGPAKALSGDEIEYEIKIQNKGKESIYNLRILPIISNDFSVNVSEPSFETDKNYWSIDTLEPGQFESVSLKGSFTASASAEQLLSAKVGFIKDDIFLEQAAKEHITDVLGGSLSFHLILDGSDKDQAVNPNQTLRGSIDFNNKGSETAEDVKFTLSIESEKATPIDWENADFGVGVLDKQSVVWSKEEIEILEEFKSGQSDIIDFSIPIKANLDSEDSDTFTLKLIAEVEKIGSITTKRTIEATPIKISINSNASVNAQVVYFTDDGVPIGTGPLPPKIGKTTTYRVFWNVNNSIHALDNVEVSTILPQDVTWRESTDKNIGTLKYNQTTRQVRWTFDKLPINVPGANAWFDISITPSDEDIGKFVKLTNQISFEAIDSKTKDELNQSLDTLSTDLPSDEFAKGKGVVIN